MTIEELNERLKTQPEFHQIDPWYAKDVLKIEEENPTVELIQYYEPTLVQVKYKDTYYTLPTAFL